MVEDEKRRSVLKARFKESKLLSMSTLQLASSLQLIYLVLVGLSGVLIQNKKEEHEKKETFYQQISKQAKDSNDQAVLKKLKDKANNWVHLKLSAKAFIQKNPEIVV